MDSHHATLEKFYGQRKRYAWAFIGLMLLASCLTCGWSALAYDTYLANLQICEDAGVEGDACQNESDKTLVDDITWGAIRISILALILMISCAFLWWRLDKKVRYQEELSGIK